MNDDISFGLKVMVERAVRPVVAPRARKKAMREELLAHVNEVFADELAKSGDDKAALARTRERFGASDTLTAELQRSVSAWQRAATRVERLDWLDGEPIWMLAWRHLLISVLSFAVVFLAIVPTVYFRGRDTLDFAIRVSIVQGLLVGPFSFGMFVVATKLSEALFGTSQQRSWRRAAVYLLGSALLFPLFAFFIYFGLSSDLAASLGHLAFACWFIPALPVLFIVVARLLHKERCYEREWSSLDLGE